MRKNGSHLCFFSLILSIYTFLLPMLLLYVIRSIFNGFLRKLIIDMSRKLQNSSNFIFLFSFWLICSHAIANGEIVSIFRSWIYSCNLFHKKRAWYPCYCPFFPFLHFRGGPRFLSREKRDKGEIPQSIHFILRAPVFRVEENYVWGIHLKGKGDHVAPLFGVPIKEIQ